ncbi:MAG: ATP-binding cassette domain-containing protein [Archangiaceae bacterium]|nr:ATP-binding cassette domain-containing protein [Archangiaceae bacterium]
MGSELFVTARVKGRLDVEGLTVPPGVTVLFGPSGAGKSTCLSVIAGLLEPDSGVVKLGDVVLSALPPHRRRVALVFQSLALFPHLDALSNVAYGARSRAEALRWLERTRAAHTASRRPAELSGGEAQRVALARALASEPKVLLLDEPFSAMDLKLRRELGAELLEVVRGVGLPTVLVTHDAEDAAAFGDRRVRLEAGRVTLL